MRDDFHELIGVLLHHSTSSSWHGALPEARDFHEYTEAERERIMSWNDASTVDQSKREDKLVDAKVQASKRGPIFAFSLALISMAMSAIIGLSTGNVVLAALFLSPSVLILAQQFIPWNRQGQGANDAEE